MQSILPLLLALLPALGWGSLAIFLRKIGGTTANQILGFGLGSVLVGLVVHVVFHPAAISWETFAISFASGMFWVLGQVGQVRAFDMIGVSRTMPISTGLQLVGTSLIGVTIFGEWGPVTSKLVGFLAIAVLIFGAYLTSKESNSSSDEKNSQLIAGIRTLVITSLGYWIYSAAPRLVDADGLSIFLPQMLGILTGAILYALMTDRKVFQQKESYQLAIVGLIFGLASLTYILSVQANGLTLAFILSQLNVVISTLSAIFILKEAKTGQELRNTYLGLALIVAASVVTVFL